MAEHEGKTTVTILTDSYRIKGYIDLLPGARVTDYLYESKDFIVVMDAEVFEIELGGRQVLTAPFIDVNQCSHVQIVTLS